ncbi:MAG: DUF1501 domain-containing protein, partial [Pirellulaceae bacterium]|nr:DUF1501 domain-containing protein [Pirellulaceae bacterium]
MTDNSTQTVVSRRQMLQAASCGVGSLLVTGMAPQRSDAGLLAPKAPHFAPKAKRVIFLFINGGPSQFESFDHKPALVAQGGKKGLKNGKLLAPLWKFAQYGESGMWASEAFPHLAQQADRLCMLNGMQTTSRAHPIAIPILHTGAFQFVRPSFGSWVLYGLGTENQNLPGFFTIKPTRTFGGPANYGSAFLPSTFQATRLGWDGQSVKKAAIRNLTPNPGLTADAARESLNLSQRMNKRILSQTADAQGVIDSLELSERMQNAVPEVLDLGRES